jgi:hypothetical protein
MISRAAIAALLALAWPAALAEAGQLIVVESRGIALHAGQTIDDAAPLVLRQGQHVTLINVDGITVKVDGPYDKPPVFGGSGGTGANALAALLTQTGARTGEVGVTRAGSEIVTLPEPWLIDVSRNGQVCLNGAAPPVFWREDSRAAATLSVTPGDRSWKAQATWPAGADRLSVTGDLPIHNGATYGVSLGRDAESALTLHVLPAALQSDAMRASWMAYLGCEAQAEALLRRTR